MVPFIDLKRYEPGFLQSYKDTFHSHLESANFIGGKTVENFERRLASETSVACAVGCGNGTDALQLALRACGVSIGDLVVVPNLTFWATLEAVVNVGAEPVIVDIELRSFSFDLDLLDNALKLLRPKAMILPHLFGFCSESTDQIRQLCKELGVLLIEDGAQSFGSILGKDSIFRHALISTVSFYPAKVLGAAGDGGAVLTNDVGLAEKVRRLGNHGRASHYSYSDVGWNSRLDSIQAAFLDLSLEFIQERITSRRNTIQYYADNIVSNVLTIQLGPTDVLSNGYLSVFLVASQELRARLIHELKTSKIGFATTYPEPIFDQIPCRGAVRYSFLNGNAAYFCQHVINLPTFPYMTVDERQFVVDFLNSLTTKI